MEIQNMKT